MEVNTSFHGFIYISIHLCCAGCLAVEEAGDDQIQYVGYPHCYEWRCEAADGEGGCYRHKQYVAETQHKPDADVQTHASFYFP